MTPAAFDLLQWVDGDLRAAFHDAARHRRYGANEIIYLRGDAGNEMFRLLRGSVRMSVATSDEKKVVFLLFEPGDCFGDSSLIDGEPRPQTAEAVNEVEVEVLDRNAFSRLRAQYRQFDDALLKLLARQMRAVSGFYADANLSDLRARVASRILAAVRSFGAEAEGGVRLSLRLSQSELALMVGASRQSVNKVMQALQDEGTITIEYGNILIRDLDQLSRACGGA